MLLFLVPAFVLLVNCHTIDSRTARGEYDPDAPGVPYGATEVRRMPDGVGLRTRLS